MRRWAVPIAYIFLLCVSPSEAQEQKERQAQQPPPQQTQQVKQEPTQQAQAEAIKVEKQTFIYNASGRRDPFLSIVIAQREAERRKQDEKRLVPSVEKFDLSQFNLIAIVWDKQEYRAVVGLPDGKFYNLKEGMSVGVNDGVITSITSNTVIVREMVKDYRGKLTAKDIPLRLR